MLKELQSIIQTDLNFGRVCTIIDHAKRFSSLKSTEIIQAYVNIYRTDKNINYDLLCYLTIHTEKGILMRFEKFSNISKGIIMSSAEVQEIRFRRNQIKQMKIIAIYPKKMTIKDVRLFSEQTQVKKTKAYTNRCIVGPILKIDSGNVELNGKKSQQIQQNKNEIKKSAIVPKVIQKQNTTKALKVEKPKIPPLSKTTSKQIKQTPVLTNYKVMRQKTDDKIEQKQKTSKQRQRKMLMQSDEEYYDKATIQNQLKMNILATNAKQTDSSAKKNDQQEKPEPMEEEKIKTKKQDKKFIVSDDDDDDDMMFAEMEAAAKKKNLSITKQAAIKVQKKIQIQKLLPSAPVPPQAAKPKKDIASSGQLNLFSFLKKTNST